MENINKLTEDQLESLHLYLECFKTAYLIQTGKRLETTSQIIECIQGNIFTFDDVFFTYIDNKLQFSQVSECWDDHMEKFDVENYFPTDKQVHSGAWIKIITEDGYEIHYAKKSIRKRRFNEEYASLANQITAMLRRGIKEMQNMSHACSIDDEKISELREKLNIISVYNEIGLAPYEVVIKRSKHKSEYYLPYQYTIVNDIDDHIKYVTNKVTGVTTKSRGTSEDEDKVFYLRSRGISEDMARLLASLNQTYFKVNMTQAMDEYNRQWSETVKIIQ
jgi:hypothetical protein